MLIGLTACAAYQPPGGYGYRHDRAQRLAGGEPPLVDVHVHYKWSQQDVTSPQQAIRTLEAHRIGAAVVIGTPPEYALKLKRLAPDRIIPVWSPYRQPSDWSTWAYDGTVLARARTALAGGEYRGIGELHLIGGFAPDWRTPVISGLLGLAGEHQLPVMLHTEISDNAYMSGLCRAFPATDIVWAHAGAVLSAKAVAEVMDDCPNVAIELSARDPWRFVNNPITDASGGLLPAWRALVEAHPDRVMVGSDPVWPVERLDSWDEPDTGWQEYGRFIDFHRGWLRRLPPELARRLGSGNAERFFKLDSGATGQGTSEPRETGPQ
jgi:hypothetical protein